MHTQETINTMQEQKTIIKMTKSNNANQENSMFFVGRV